MLSNIDTWYQCDYNIVLTFLIIVINSNYNNYCPYYSSDDYITVTIIVLTLFQKVFNKLAKQLFRNDTKSALMDDIGVKKPLCELLLI